MKRRDLQTAESILAGLLKRPDLKRKVAEYQVVPYWAQAVDEETARRARPEKIIHGHILVVRVANASWAQDLSLRKTAILEQLREIDPSLVIDDIHFRIGNPRDFA